MTTMNARTMRRDPLRLDALLAKGEWVIITKYRKPLYVIVPVGDLEWLKRREQKKLEAVAEESERG